MKILRVILYNILIVLFLTGCQYHIAISASGIDPYKPIFYFDTELPLHRDPGNAYIYGLEVFKFNQPTPLEQWHIILSRHEEYPIGEIRYGEIPLGFKEIIKAEKLQANTFYEILVKGSGTFGHIYFRIENQDGMYILKNL